MKKYERKRGQSIYFRNKVKSRGKKNRGNKSRRTWGRDERYEAKREREKERVRETEREREIERERERESEREREKRRLADKQSQTWERENI